MIGGFEFGPGTPNLHIPPELQRKFESIHEDYRAARSQYAENLEKAKVSKTKVKKPKKMNDHAMLDTHKELLRNLTKVNSKLSKATKVQKLLTLSRFKFPFPTKGFLSVHEIAEDFALKYCDSLFALRGKCKQTQLVSVSLWIQIQVLRRITESCNILSKEKKASEDTQSLFSFLTLVRRKLIEHVQSFLACMTAEHRQCLSLPDREEINQVADQVKGFYELIAHDFSNGNYKVTDAVTHWNNAYRVHLLMSNLNIHMPEVWDRYGKNVYSFRTKKMEDVVVCFNIVLESMNRFPEPTEKPLHMLVTYMTGPGDLLQLYSLVAAAKESPKYKLNNENRRRILETCRNVATEIIGHNYAKSVKEANSGSSLTKTLSEKLVKMGMEYARLAEKTSDADCGVSHDDIRIQLLHESLEQFHTRNKFWPQCIGMLLRGYFSDFDSDTPLVELPKPAFPIQVPSFKPRDKVSASDRESDESAETLPIVFGSDFEDDFVDKDNKSVLLEMNSIMVSALRSYVDAHRRNLQAAILLLIEQNFVHDCFLIKSLLHAPAADDLINQKSSTLKDWYQVFQHMIKLRGSSIFSPEASRVRVLLSRSFSGFLKSMKTHPEYSGHDKMFMLLRDFLEMIFDIPELLKCPSDPLLIKTLFSPLRKELDPDNICEAIVKNIPKSFNRGLMDEVKLNSSELWANIYYTFLDTLQVSELEMYNCPSSVMQFFKSMKRICNKGQQVFWQLVIQRNFDRHAKLFFTAIHRPINMQLYETFTTPLEVADGYARFISEARQRTQELFHEDPQMRKICMRDIYNFRNQENQVQDISRLVSLIAVDNFAPEDIKLSIESSANAINLIVDDLKDHLNVFLEALGDCYNVQNLPQRATFSDINSETLRYLLQRHHDIATRLLIDVSDSDFAVRSSVSDMISSPTFDPPPFLITAAFFSGVHCWLFSVVYGKYKTKHLIECARAAGDDESLRAFRSDELEHFLTIEVFQGIMMDVIAELKTLFQSNKLDFSKLKEYWQLSTNEAEDGMLETQSMNRTDEQYDLASNVRIIAQCSVFSDLVHGAGQSLDTVCHDLDSAQYVEKVLQVMNNFSKLCQHIHESVSEEMVNAKRRTAVESLQHFCTQQLQNFESITLSQVGDILGKVSEIVCPLDINQDERLNLIDLMTRNMPLVSFLLSKQCYHVNGKDKFIVSVTEAMKNCRSRKEKTNTDLLASLRFSVSLIWPLIDVSSDMESVMLEINKFEVGQALNMAINHLQCLTPDNLKIVKTLYIQQGSYSLDNALDVLKRVCHKSKILQISLPTPKHPFDLRLEIHTEMDAEESRIRSLHEEDNENEEKEQYFVEDLTGNDNGNVDHEEHQSVITQEKLRVVERVVAFALEDEMDDNVSEDGEDPAAFMEDFGDEEVERLKAELPSRRELLKFFTDVSELFDLVVKLYYSGHPGFQKDPIVFCMKELQPTDNNAWSRKILYLRNNLKQWEDVVSYSRNNSKYLSFFSIRQILNIRQALLMLEPHVDSNLDDGFCALWISRLRDYAVSLTNENLSQRAHRSALRSIDFSAINKDPFDSIDTSLADNSLFLMEIDKFFFFLIAKEKSVTAPSSVNPLTRQTLDQSFVDARSSVESATEQNIHADGLAMMQQIILEAEDFSEDQLFRLVISLYNGFPMSHQILWCSENTCADELSLFLHRTSKVKNTYCLVQVNLLPLQIQSLVASLQDDFVRVARQTRAHQSTLYFIQTKRCRLSSNPWLIVKKPIDIGRDLWIDQQFQNFQQDIRKYFDFRVTCVVGRTGDGKSRKIFKLLDGRLFRTIHIYEAITLLDLINALQKAQEENVRNIVFKISGYACGASLDRFLFSLFVFGRLDDFRSGRAFTIKDSGHWHFFVEVPSYRNRPSMSPGEHSPDWNVDELALESPLEDIEAAPIVSKTNVQSNSDISSSVGFSVSRQSVNPASPDPQDQRYSVEPSESIIDRSNIVSRFDLEQLSKIVSSDEGVWGATVKSLKSHQFWKSYICDHLELPVLYYAAKDDIQIVQPDAEYMFDSRSERLVGLYLNAMQNSIEFFNSQDSDKKNKLQKKGFFGLSSFLFRTKKTKEFRQKKNANFWNRFFGGGEEILDDAVGRDELSIDCLSSKQNAVASQALLRQLRFIHQLIRSKKSFQKMIIEYLGYFFDKLPFEQENPPNVSSKDIGKRKQASPDGIARFPMEVNSVLEHIRFGLLNIMADQASAYACNCAEDMMLSLPLAVFEESIVSVSHDDVNISYQIGSSWRVLEFLNNACYMVYDCISSNSLKADKISEITAVQSQGSQLTSKLSKSFEELNVLTSNPLAASSETEDHWARYLAKTINANIDRVISILRDRQYILTEEYFMKMILVYERMICLIPTVIVGETGVGKTELIRVLSSLIATTRAIPNEAEESWAFQVVNTAKGLFFEEHERIANSMTRDELDNLSTRDEAVLLMDAISETVQNNPSILDKNKGKLVNFFRIMSKQLLNMKDTFPHIDLADSELEYFRKSVAQILENDPAQVFTRFNKYLKKNFKALNTFFSLGIHGALTANEVNDWILNRVKPIADQLMAQSARLRLKPVIVTVFFDELNTASCLDVFEEIMLDRRCKGIPLPNNIWFVAAINPLKTADQQAKLDLMLSVQDFDKASLELSKNESRVKSVHDMSKLLQADHSTMYMVRDLPGSLRDFTRVFSGLDDKQLTSYIRAKVRNLFVKFSSQKPDDKQIQVLSAWVRTAHKWIRTNLGDGAVSQRDIQRAFNLWHYFTHEMPHISFLYCGCAKCEKFALIYSNNREVYELRSMICAIALTYYSRLLPKKRKEFEPHFDMAYSNAPDMHISNVLQEFIDLFLHHVQLPHGVAMSHALSENIFAMIVCCVNIIPLLVIGEPGTSKTLSFHIVGNTLRGSSSQNKFFQKFPAIDHTRFQGSESTSSREISEAFSTAIDTQQRLHDMGSVNMNVVQVLFFDEVGLTSSYRQPLKVLHYYLDNPQVGFVGISNRILDPARMNRAIVIRRGAPEKSNLYNVAEGILGFQRQGYRAGAPSGLRENVRRLSDGYHMLMENPNYANFFGLRDFYHFLRYIDRNYFKSQIEMTKESDDTEDKSFANSSKFVNLTLRALERNFSGLDASDFDELCRIFFKEVDPKLNLSILSKRHQLSVFVDSLSDKNPAVGNLNDVAVRFKLVIDETPDQCMTRTLFSVGMLQQEQCEIFCGSVFPNDQAESYERDLVNRIILAIEKGKTLIMMKTKRIDDNFYDLFNQFYTPLTIERGNKTEIRYLASISIGGSFTRRIRVHPKFQCIVIRDTSEVGALPPPFLNRFEKYRLSVHSVLSLTIEKLPPLIKEQVNLIMSKIYQFVDLLGASHMYGMKKQGNDNSTIGSIFLDSICPKYLFALMHSELTSTSKFHHGPRSEIEDSVAGFRNLFSFSSHIENVMEETKDTASSSFDANSFDSVREQVILRICMRLLQITTPSTIFVNRLRIQRFFRAYIRFQEHFSLERLLENVISAPKSENSIFQISEGHKHLVYTRSNSMIMKASTHQKPIVSSTLAGGKCIIQQFHLDSLKSEMELRKRLQEFYALPNSSLDASDQCHVLLAIMDVRSTESMLLLNICRQLMDRYDFQYNKMAARNPSAPRKKAVLFLHFPPSSLVSSNMCYPALFLYGWDFYFLDCFDSNDAVEGVDFDALRMSLQDFEVSSANQIAKTVSTGVDLDRIMRSMLRDVIPKSFVSAKARGLRIPSEWDADLIYDLLASPRFDLIWSHIVEIFRQAWGDSLPDELFRRAAEMVHQKHLYLDLVQATKRFFEDRLMEFWTLMLLELGNANVLFMMKEEEQLESNVDLMQFIVDGLDNSINDIRVHTLNVHVQFSQNKTKSCSPILLSDLNLDSFAMEIRRFPWFDDVHRVIEMELSSLESSLRNAKVSAAQLMSKLESSKIWFWKYISQNENMKNRYLQEFMTNSIAPNAFERRVFLKWFRLYPNQSVPDWHIIVNQNLDIIQRQLSTMRALRELTIQPTSDAVVDTSSGTSDVELVLQNPGDLRSNLPIFILRYMCKNFYEQISQSSTDDAWLHCWVRALHQLIGDIWSFGVLGDNSILLDVLALIRLYYLTISTESAPIAVFAQFLRCSPLVGSILQDLGIAIDSEQTPMVSQSILETALTALEKSLLSMSSYPKNIAFRLRRMLQGMLEFFSRNMKQHSFLSIHQNVEFILDMLANGIKSKFAAFWAISEQEKNFDLLTDSISLQLLSRTLLVAEDAVMDDHEKTLAKSESLGFRPQVKEHLERTMNSSLEFLYRTVCCDVIKQDLVENTTLTLESLINYSLRFERQLSSDDTRVKQIERKALYIEFQKRLSSIMVKNMRNFDIEADVNNTTLYFKQINDWMDEERNFQFWISLYQSVGMETISLWLSEKNAKSLKFWNWFNWKEDWEFIKDHFGGPRSQFIIDENELKNQHGKRARRVKGVSGKVGEFDFHMIPTSHSLFFVDDSYIKFAKSLLLDFQSQNFVDEKDIMNKFMKVVRQEVLVASPSEFPAVNQFFVFLFNAIYFHVLRCWTLPKEDSMSEDLVVSLLKIIRSQLSTPELSYLSAPTHKFKVAEIPEKYQSSGLFSRRLKSDARPQGGICFQSHGVGSNHLEKSHHLLFLDVLLDPFLWKDIENSFNYFSFLSKNVLTDGPLQGFMDCVSNVISIALGYPGGRNHLWYLMFLPEVVCNNAWCRTGSFFSKNSLEESYDACLRLSEGHHPLYRHKGMSSHLISPHILLILQFANYAALWVGLSLNIAEEYPTFPEGILDASSEDHLQKVFNQSRECFSLLQDEFKLSFPDTCLVISRTLSSFCRDFIEKPLMMSKSFEDYKKEDLEMHETAWVRAAQYAIISVGMEAQSIGKIHRSMVASEEFASVSKEAITAPLSPSFKLFKASLDIFLGPEPEKRRRFDLLYRYVIESGSWNLFMETKSVLKLYLWLKSSYEGRLRKDHAQIISIQELIKEHGAQTSKSLQRNLSSVIDSFNNLMNSELVPPSQRIPPISENTAVISFLTTSKYHNDENDFLFKWLDLVVKIHNDFIECLSTYIKEYSDDFEALKHLSSTLASKMSIQQISPSTLLSMDHSFEQRSIFSFVGSIESTSRTDLRCASSPNFDLSSLQYSVATQSTLLSKSRFRELEHETIFSEFRFRDLRNTGRVVEGDEFVQLPNQYHEDVPENLRRTLANEYHALDLLQIERKLEALKSTASVLLGMISEGIVVEDSSIGGFVESYLDVGNRRDLESEQLLQIIPLNHIVGIIKFFQEKLSDMDYVYASIHLSKKQPLQAQPRRELVKLSQTFSTLLDLKLLYGVLSLLTRALDVKSMDLEMSIADFLTAFDFASADEICGSDDPQKARQILKSFLKVLEVHKLTGEVSVEVHRCVAGLRSSVQDEVLKHEQNLLSKPFKAIDEEDIALEADLDEFDVDKVANAVIEFKEHPLTTLLAGILGTQLHSSSSSSRGHQELLKFLSDKESEDNVTHVWKSFPLHLERNELNLLYSHLLEDFAGHEVSIEQIVQREKSRRVVLCLEETLKGTDHSLSLLPVLRTVISLLQGFLKDKLPLPGISQVSVASLTSSSVSKTSGDKHQNVRKNLFMFSWHKLCLNDERASLVEDKLFEILTKGRASGSIKASFVRSAALVVPLTTPQTHTLSRMGLHFGDLVDRQWVYWGEFDSNASCITNTKGINFLNALTRFEVQSDEVEPLPEDIQAGIQQELLPTIKRQMRQIEEFLLSIESVAVEEKTMDVYLNVFNDVEVRTMEDLKKLTNDDIEDIVASGNMPDEIGEALYEFRDQHIQSILSSEISLDTSIEDVLEVVREQIPSDFNRDELENVLKELREKGIENVENLQAMKKRTYERVLRRLQLSSRCLDLLHFLHRVPLTGDESEQEDMSVQEDESVHADEESRFNS